MKNATPSDQPPDVGPVNGDPEAVPSPRSGADPLPRRIRPGSSDRKHEPDAAPGSSPDGRPYTAADEATLNRLLTGLREI